MIDLILVFVLFYFYVCYVPFKSCSFVVSSIYLALRYVVFHVCGFDVYFFCLQSVCVIHVI